MGTNISLALFREAVPPSFYFPSIPYPIALYREAVPSSYLSLQTSAKRFYFLRLVLRPSLHCIQCQRHSILVLVTNIIQDRPPCNPAVITKRTGNHATEYGDIFIIFSNLHEDRPPCNHTGITKRAGNQAKRSMARFFYNTVQSMLR